MWTCVLNVETRKRLQHANEPQYNYVANALYTLDADLHTLVLHVHLSDGLYWGQCFLGSLVLFPGAGTGVWVFSTGNVHRRVGWVACHTPFMDGPRGPLCNWPRGLGPVSGALGGWHAAWITSWVSSFSVYGGGALVGTRDSPRSLGVAHPVARRGSTPTQYACMHVFINNMRRFRVSCCYLSL